MRGERVEGSRFTINHERGSIIKGTTKEIVRTVGYDLEWWLYIAEGSSLSTSETLLIPELRALPTNPDAFLRDRVVFKNQVFSPRQVLPKGIITNDYTLFSVVCYQVNAEELINDPQFAEYATYTPFGPRDRYSFYEDPEGTVPGI